MALETQNGEAVLHGIRSNGTRLAISGFASFIIEGAKLSHKFQMDEVKDELGFDRALVATNGHVEAEITFVPSGATRAAAQSGAVFLAPQSKVSLSNFAVAACNGDWIYVGDQSLDLSTKMGKMSLKIRKYDDAVQNASLATTITG